MLIGKKPLRAALCSFAAGIAHEKLILAISFGAKDRLGRFHCAGPSGAVFSNPMAFATRKSL